MAAFQKNKELREQLAILEYNQVILIDLIEKLTETFKELQNVRKTS